MNTDDYNAFYDMLGHHQTGGLTPLVALIPRKDKYIPKTAYVQSGSEIEEFAKKYNGNAQCYVSLNPVRSDIDKRANHLDDDVTHICNILIDVDPEKSDSTISDSDVKKYAATDVEKEKAVKDADVIADWLTGNNITFYRDDSGNGNRFMVAIEPIVLTDDNRARIKELLKALQHHIQAETGIKIDTSVHDFRRITGIPGTLNLKKETETRKNRMRLPSLPIPERAESAYIRDLILSFDVDVPPPAKNAPVKNVYATNDSRIINKIAVIRSPPLTDSEIYAKLEGNEYFKKLNSGDISGFKSASEADYNFLKQVAYHTQNEEQLCRFIRNSQLQPDTRHPNAGYLHTTITNVLWKLTASYQRDGAPFIDLDTILEDISTFGSVLTRSGNAKNDFKKLSRLPISDRMLGCKEIWKKYKLELKTFDQAYKEVFEDITPTNRPKAQQKEEPVENDVLDIYSDDVKGYAMDILKHGDPFTFILEVVNKYHVGDENIKKLCLVSFGTCHITTTYGLQLKPSGPSGKGKTHTFDNVAIVLPSHRIFRGSMSGMAAYYNEKTLKDGMIFLLDDTDLNRTEGLKNTIKRASSNFQKRTTHLTVVKGKGKEVEIPSRVLWWISSVRGVDDDQLGNRFLPIDVDSTTEQDMKVYDWQKNQHLYGLDPEEDIDVQVCRCIYDILGKETYKIVVPFVDAIEWNNKDNRRNFPMFLDVVMGVTSHYIKQRKCVNGVYWSTVEDCEKAIEIYGQIEEQNASNLTDEETNLISWMGDQFRAGSWLDRNAIQGYINRSNKYTRDLLHGEDAKGGLLAKVPKLEYEKRQVKDDTGAREKVFYRMTGPYHKFGEIVRLEKEAVDDAIKNFNIRGGTSCTSSALVLKKTSGFSQSVDTNTRAVVQNSSSVIEEIEDTILDVHSDDNSINGVCVNSDILAEQGIRTSAHRITPLDNENALVKSGTSAELVSTSAYGSCLSEGKRQMLLEKIPRWERGNFKITAENIPRAVLGIAELVRETNTDTIKNFLLEYVNIAPAEVTP